jgi:predicted nucleic acid-binding protein
MPNSWVCLDAGVIVRVVAFPDDAVVQTCWREWIAAQRQIIAPTLILYEVTNVLYQYQKHSMLTEQAATAALDTVLALPIILFGDAELHRAAVGVARRYSLAATCDAHYVALAERYGAELWTTDHKLVNRCQQDWIRLAR